MLFSSKPGNQENNLPEGMKENPKDAKRREFLKLERDLTNFPDDFTKISYLKNIVVDSICQSKQLNSKLKSLKK